MRRRSLLAIPPLGALAWAVAACQPREDRPVSSPDPSSAGRYSYGDDPSQFGDLYLPTDRPPRGVVVVVHGGFWKSEYDLQYGAPLAADLAERGWAAWNLEYRRVGNGGGVPETLVDVATGIDRLAGLDLRLDDGVSLADLPVVSLGHSAGGHLATWAAGPARERLVPVEVALTHVVSQAGVLDLVSASRDGLGQGAVEAFLGHPATAEDADVDPLQQVPLDVPVWCVHGGDDDVVPPSQSADYVAAATSAGAEAELVRVDGDHFAVIDITSPAWDRTLEIFDALLETR